MPLSGIALVTGGAGFIGSHLASALSEQGARVRVIDDLSTGSEENLREIGGDIDFIKASVTDTSALAGALENVELIFHEAAIPSVPRSVENPAEAHGGRVNGTVSVLLVPKAKQIRRVVDAPASWP